MKNHFKYLLPAIPVTMLLLVGCSGSDNNDIPVFNIAVAPAGTIWFDPAATNAATTLTATVTPVDATNPAVQWWLTDSSNYATLTSSGATATVAFRPGATAPPASAHAQGTTTLRAHATDGSFKQSNLITVNVARPVTAASMQDFLRTEWFTTGGASLGAGPAITQGGVLQVPAAMAGRVLAVYLSPKPWDARFKTISVTSSNTNVATVGTGAFVPKQAANYNNNASDTAYQNAYGPEAWEAELAKAMEAVAYVTITNNYGQSTITITSANRNVSGSFTVRNIPPS